MLFSYIKFEDETEVNHTQIIEKDGIQKVEVHFERPTEKGFDSARCELPTYKWLFNKGYSDEEIKNFEKFLERNAHLIYKYAREGGE